jgi:AraC-like DNA-binding protein
MKLLAPPLRPGQVRVAPFANAQRVLQSLGCEWEPVFARAGVDPRCLHDIDNRIDYLSGLRLLEECARTSGCEHFGLLLGQWFLAHQLGLTWRLAETAPDVATALADIERFLGLHESGGILTLHATAGRVFLGHAIVEPGLGGSAEGYDLSVAVLCIVMRSFCGGSWSPSEVHLMRVRPENVRPYEIFFRAPVIFDAEQSQLVFPKKWVTEPLPTASVSDHFLLERQAREILSAERHGFCLQVRDALRRTIAAGEQASATSVAEQLGLHERTLNRRLQDEGTSYRQLRELVLQTLSLQYLEATQLPIVDIASVLGYCSIAAFDRAFQRWFGTSPTNLRAETLRRRAAGS